MLHRLTQFILVFSLPSLYVCGFAVQFKFDPDNCLSTVSSMGLNPFSWGLQWGILWIQVIYIIKILLCVIIYNCASVLKPSSLFLQVCSVLRQWVVLFNDVGFIRIRSAPPVLACLAWDHGQWVAHYAPFTYFAIWNNCTSTLQPWASKELVLCTHSAKYL